MPASPPRNPRTKRVVKKVVKKQQVEATQPPLPPEPQKVKKDEKIQLSNAPVGDLPTFRRILSDHYEQMIGKFLPSGHSHDQFERVCLNAFVTNSNIKECSIISVVSSLSLAAQMGLAPNGCNGDAWLVGFDSQYSQHKEAKLIPGYKGIHRLCMNHPRVKMIDSKTVHENDIFEYEDGTDGFLQHTRPKLNEPRGKPIGAYSRCWLEGAPEPLTVVMDQDSILKRRPRKFMDSFLWTQWEEIAYLKTCLIQIARLIPKSFELSMALEAETLAYNDETQLNLAPCNSSDHSMSHSRSNDLAAKLANITT